MRCSLFDVPMGVLWETAASRTAPFRHVYADEDGRQFVLDDGGDTPVWRTLADRRAAGGPFGI